MDQICDDLAAEHADLDAVVARLNEAQWEVATPAEGWSIRDQVSHLAYFDATAKLAATDADAFAASAAALMRDGGPDASVMPGRGMAPGDLLAWWRAGRDELLAVLRSLDPRARLPWYGPPMGARSFATARLMETWAHGQDIVDALALERSPTARLRHVAHIGVAARPFSYRIRGRDVPDEPIQVVLDAPDGGSWTWGDPSTPHRVSGNALDFCLVVTQRRHRDDTALVAEGALANEWLDLAQAFAGPPGPGRPPLRPPVR